MGSTLDTSQHGLFCSNMEAHREPEVLFLLDYGFFCPLQLPFPHPAPRKWALLLTRLMPANLSKKKRQPATSCGSSKTRSERSCPQEKHLFLPFPYTSLGTEQRVTPTSKTELMLLPESSDAQTQGLMTGNQEQGMRVTKQNQALLFDLPLSCSSHPRLLYPEPEPGMRNKLGNSFQPPR